MKKIGLFLVYLAVFVSAIFPQESTSLVDTFITNFKRGNNNVKLEVLMDSVQMGLPGMGPLYLEAVNYVLTKAEVLQNDLTIRKVGRYAVEQIGIIKYTEAKDVIWDLFVADKDTGVRVTVLNALGDIAVRDTRMINNLNIWLRQQNNVFLSGITPDLLAVEACIIALGKLGDPSSFPLLFTAYTIEYSDGIHVKARTALDSIQGNIKQLYSGIIRSGTFNEKRTALSDVIAHDKLNDSQKCEVAQYALDIALNTAAHDPEDKKIARDIRYKAVGFISEKNWSGATSLMIDHFNLAITELDKGIANKSNLVQAIDGLGNMQNTISSKRLSLYLDLLNSYTESGRAYDEQIILSVIISLKRLGDMKTASRPLFYTKYLNYSDRVKKAAADALKNLK